MSLPLALKSTPEKLSLSIKDRQLNAAMLRDQRVRGKPIETAGASNVLGSLLGGLLSFSMLICAPARASELMPPSAYEVTTETGMPHLEENLR